MPASFFYPTFTKVFFIFSTFFTFFNVFFNFHLNVYYLYVCTRSQAPRRLCVTFWNRSTHKSNNSIVFKTFSTFLTARLVTDGHRKFWHKVEDKGAHKDMSMNGYFGDFSQVKSLCASTIRHILYVWWMKMNIMLSVISVDKSVNHCDTVVDWSNSVRVNFYFCQSVVSL